MIIQIGRVGVIVSDQPTDGCDCEPCKISKLCADNEKWHKKQIGDIIRRIKTYGIQYQGYSVQLNAVAMRIKSVILDDKIGDNTPGFFDDESIIAFEKWIYETLELCRPISFGTQFYALIEEMASLIISIRQNCEKIKSHLNSILYRNMLAGNKLHGIKADIRCKMSTAA